MAIDPVKCAWPMSDRASAVLAPGTLPLAEKRLCYTMPGVITSAIPDPIDAARMKFPELAIATRPAMAMAASLDALDALIVSARLANQRVSRFSASGNLLAAFNTTSMLLADHGQGVGRVHQPSANSPESLQLWTCRFQLLLALGMHAEVNAELDAFDELDAPDLYAQYYPERFKGAEGSIVPFCLRVIHAEAPRWTAEPLVAVARMQSLTSTVQKMVTNLTNSLSEDGRHPVDAQRRAIGLQVWNARAHVVARAMIRVLFHIKESQLARKFCGELVIASAPEMKANLLALQARMCMYSGDDAGTSACVEKIPATASEAKMTRVLYSVFLGNYGQAYDQLQKAIAAGDGDANTINNASVCLLYMGQLPEAIALLEKNMRGLNEPMTRNLASLYELTSQKSNAKKEALVKSVGERQTDAFNWQCLKL